MASAIFYVDESGDLGWTFSAPYRNGGSSRYLTIATLICPTEKKHLPKRLITNIYKKYSWDSKIEKKWSDMSAHERERFAKSANDLISVHQDIKLTAITVYKQNVSQRMRLDSNQLYNYMIMLSAINEMSKFDTVTLIPDPRSIKVKSGNSLHDYLDINLAFVKKVNTVLQTNPCNSSCCKGIQFSDMLSGLVQNHFEDSQSICWNLLKDKITHKKLFFPT